MSLLSLQEVCFENLLLLGFGPVASERKSGRAPLHPTMFDTANKTAMQVGCLIGLIFQTFLNGYKEGGGGLRRTVHSIRIS